MLIVRSKAHQRDLDSTQGTPDDTQEAPWPLRLLAAFILISGGSLGVYLLVQAGSHIYEIIEAIKKLITHVPSMIRETINFLFLLACLVLFLSHGVWENVGKLLQWAVATLLGTSRQRRVIRRKQNTLHVTIMFVACVLGSVLTVIVAVMND